MKKVLYVMNVGGNVSAVCNKPFPNAESTIEQHDVDITAWRDIPEGAMLVCHDAQAAANQHAHLLCWHIKTGAKEEVIKSLAAVAESLIEYVEEWQPTEPTEPPSEPHTTH